MIRKILLPAVILYTLATAAYAAVPSPDEFLGYRAGRRLTPVSRIDAYFETLAKSSPRITITKYGESYEGQPLIYAVITSEKNRARLDSIREKISSLGRPAAATAEDAKTFAAGLPAIVWLGFGVHGDEASSSEAAMRVAYELVSDLAPEVLDSLVVIIDPIQNPDGRSMYVQNVTQALGAVPNPNRDAIEHRSDWREGRANHYLLDLNRDWAWGTQQETRSRVAAYLQWMPQVFVDLHEMYVSGGDYFFPPVADPVNANIDPEARRFYDIFGKANAKAFDAKNWSFFVGEKFDLFYPSYGDSWPTLHGAIGMTYEVAGKTTAIEIERPDGTVLTLADKIDRHYTAAMTTLHTAAAHREELLVHSWNATRKPPAELLTWLVPPAAGAERRLLALLRYNGIEVSQLAKPVTLRAERVAGGSASRTFDAGTLVVRTRQPFGGLARTLLERTPLIPESFIREEQQKMQRDESDDFYDITAWSLPLALNVDGYFVKGEPDLPLQPAATAAVPAFREAHFGYLVDALDPAVYSAAGEFLRRRIRFFVVAEDLATDGGTVRRGSLLVRRNNNAADLDTELQATVAATGVSLKPLESAWGGGVSLGSSSVVAVVDPRIGIVAGHGVDSSAFGALWHALDVDTGIPHTVLPVERLDKIDLRRYGVLVFPDGKGYEDTISADAISALQQWVKSGGTIVATKGATDFLRSPAVELSKIRMASDPPKKEKKAEEAAAEDDTETKRRNEPRVPGAAFRTSFRDHSYLTFGVERAPAVVMEGTDAILPLTRETDNVVSIATEDPLIAGFAWPESIEKLRGSVWLAAESVGKGAVVTFADEPFFRTFWRGTLPMFCDAVLYSPTFNERD